MSSKSIEDGMKGLKFVTVGKKRYICLLDESGERPRLSLASEITEDDRWAEWWVAEQNEGKLLTVKLSADAGFTFVEMDPRERIELTNQWERMQEIKRTAITHLENSLFFKTKI